MSTTPPRRPADHPSLADAFAAPPARAAGLADLLPARPAPAADTPSGEAPAGEKPTRTANGPQRAAQPRQKPKTAAADADDDHVVSLPVYLPPDILERLTEATQGRTYADVLLEAFEQVDDDALRTALTPPRPSSRRGIPTRPAPRTGAPGIQRQLRVTNAQRRWIEAKATELGTSRSALCVQALRLHFAAQATTD
jgi:hypothetical protein